MFFQQKRVRITNFGSGLAKISRRKTTEFQSLFFCELGGTRQKRGNV